MQCVHAFLGHVCEPQLMALCLHWVLLQHIRCYHASFSWFLLSSNPGRRVGGHFSLGVTCRAVVLASESVGIYVCVELLRLVEQNMSLASNGRQYDRRRQAFRRSGVSSRLYGACFFACVTLSLSIFQELAAANSLRNQHVA